MRAWRGGWGGARITIILARKNWCSKSSDSSLSFPNTVEKRNLAVRRGQETRRGRGSGCLKPPLSGDRFLAHPHVNLLKSVLVNSVEQEDPANLWVLPTSNYNQGIQETLWKSPPPSDIFLRLSHKKNWTNPTLRKRSAVNFLAFDNLCDHLEARGWCWLSSYTAVCLISRTGLLIKSGVGQFGSKLQGWSTCLHPPPLPQHWDYRCA